MSPPRTHPIRLNLKLPADRVQMGKAMARRNGTTVSALVSQFFLCLAQLESEPNHLHPLYEQLAGIIPDPGLFKRDVVMEELERKYGPKF